MTGNNYILDFDLEQFRDVADIVKTMKRISVSGVQEKFPAIVENGKVRLARRDERSTHILKPAPWDRTLRARNQIPANEYLTMQIANQVYGIETATYGLCFTPSKKAVFITRRFDILPDGSKLLMEDFATIIGRDEADDGIHFKYMGSYEDIAKDIRKHVAEWEADLERFFNLVLFNYIYGNGDAHTKNFSLIKYGDNFRLAPAYDLLNTHIHIDDDDFALSEGLSPNIETSEIMDKTGHPCRLDFFRFGILIGISEPRLNDLLNRYAQLPTEVETMISNSYLDEKTKRSYLRIVQERISRFVRVAED